MPVSNSRQLVTQLQMLFVLIVRMRLAVCAANHYPHLVPVLAREGKGGRDQSLTL